MFLKNSFFLISIILFTSVLSCKKKEEPKEVVSVQRHQFPYAKKKPYSHDVHGVELFDEYHWMEEKDSSEVVAYLQEENKYLDSILLDSQGLYQLIYDELRENAVPIVKYITKIGDTEYYSKREIDEVYPVYYKKSNLGSGTEEVILNFNDYNKNGLIESLGFFEISPDQQHMAFSYKNENEDDYTLVIQNISNHSLSDTVPAISNSATWAEDGQTIFYTTADETGRSDKIFNHKIYLPYEEDKMEFHEEDPDFHVSVHKSKDKRFVIIQTESSTTSESHYLSANDPNQDFKLFSSRMPGHKYEVFPHLNSFYIVYKDENSFEQKLMKATEGATERKNWQAAEVANDNQSLDYLDVFTDFLVLYKSEKGVPFIEIKDFNKNTSQQMFFEENTYTLKPVSASSFNDATFRFEYESLLTPPSVFEVEVKTGDKKLLNALEIPDYDKDSFISEKIFIETEDGMTIPVSLVYHRNIPKDGSAPLYLYQGGSNRLGSTLQQNTSVSFSNRLSLLKRGFIFAIADIRGSETMGNEWKEKGKGMNKRIAINDFITSAKSLIEMGYTSPEKLVASGEGIEALIIASAVNARPEIFNIIIAKNPKTELLRLKGDENAENPVLLKEFGNPEEEDVFNLLLTYSPYDNIEVKAYPNFFIFSDYHNKEISYYEATKWAARLREYNTSQNTILLKTNFSAHSALSDKLKDVALEYTFILKKSGYKGAQKTVAGMKKP